MFNTGYMTVISAQELASLLTRSYTGETTMEYIDVNLVSSTEPPLKVEVRLREKYGPEKEERQPDANTIIGGSEILRCITPKGKMVDFLIPASPEERERSKGVLPAYAMVEDGI